MARFGRTRSATGETCSTNCPAGFTNGCLRLAEEGVVGADAIFCLGPALEVFSRYCHVEKASGEAVSLRIICRGLGGRLQRGECSLIFREADAGGLEPDARLTAMWLWTLSTGRTDGRRLNPG